MDAAAGSSNRSALLRSACFHLLTDSDALFRFRIPPSWFHRLGGPGPPHGSGQTCRCLSRCSVNLGYCSGWSRISSGLWGTKLGASNVLAWLISSFCSYGDVGSDRLLVSSILLRCLLFTLSLCSWHTDGNLPTTACYFSITGFFWLLMDFFFFIEQTQLCA